MVEQAVRYKDEYFGKGDIVEITWNTQDIGYTDKKYIHHVKGRISSIRNNCIEIDSSKVWESSTRTVGIEQVESIKKICKGVSVNTDEEKNTSE